MTDNIPDIRPAPCARKGHVAVVIGDAMYIHGGVDKVPVDRAWCTLLPPLHTAIRPITPQPIPIYLTPA